MFVRSTPHRPFSGLAVPGIVDAPAVATAAVRGGVAGCWQAASASDEARARAIRFMGSSWLRKIIERRVARTPAVATSS